MLNVTKFSVIDWSSISNINRLNWHQLLLIDIDYHRLSISLISHTRVLIMCRELFPKIKMIIVVVFFFYDYHIDKFLSCSNQAKQWDTAPLS